jgi:quercetin dioxygenase-like cupin family protein
MQILYLAEKLPCDLIVMGSHGRTGLSRLLTGSVAEEVFRKSACPVMIVNTPPPPTQRASAENVVKAGEVVDVRPLGADLASSQTRTLARSEGLEIIRLVVSAKKEFHDVRPKGDTVVQCLEGRVSLAALGETRSLQAGELLILPQGKPYTVRGIEDASLLVTILLPKR